MNDYARHADGLQQIQARLADDCPVVTWGQGSFKVVPGSAHRRRDLAAGGFQLNADFRFDALVASFGYEDAILLKNDLLQTPVGYLGDSYKVDAVTILPGGRQIIVDCNALNQDA